MATDWRIAVLKQGGFPVTPQNLQNLDAWQHAEGGHTNNAAKYNWLNTTQGKQYPSMNSVGVRVFPDFNTGVQKTVETLNNGHYASILQALKSGRAPVDQFAQSVYSSPWGTKHGIAGGTAAPRQLAATVPQAGVPANTPKAQPQVTVKQLNGLARQFGFGSFRQAFGFDDDGQIAALLNQRAPVPTVAKLAGGTIPVYNNAGRNLPTKARKVVELADDFLGTPYSWAGGNASGPTTGTGKGANTVGFDCSGFALYLYAKVGIKLPHLAAAQFRMGQRVSDPRALQEGDLVFFRSSGTDQDPGHMGIYMGNGLMIHAPKTGDVVKVSRLADRTDFVGASRFF